LQVILGNLSNCPSIDIEHVARNFANEFRPAIFQIYHSTIFGNNDVLFVDASLSGQSSICNQVSEFTVHWHYIFWLQDVIAIEKFAGSGVTLAHGSPKLDKLAPLLGAWQAALPGSPLAFRQLAAALVEAAARPSMGAGGQACSCCPPQGPSEAAQAADMTGG
jgi:hypothetical protein